MTFNLFWSQYPLRVAKKAAQKAWDKATLQTPPETILIGLARYLANKPDWANWMHPATFLNGERWTDEYAKPQLNGVAAQREKLRQEIEDGFRPQGQDGTDPGYAGRLFVTDGQRPHRPH